MKLSHILLFTILVTSLAINFYSPENDEVKVDAWTGASAPSLNKSKQIIPARRDLLSRWRNDKDVLKRPAGEYAHFYSDSYQDKTVSRGELNAIGDTYGMIHDVLYYQNKKESSGGCAKKPNHKGAVGCFQFLPSTAREFGLINDNGDYTTSFHASAEAAEAAARYLTWLLLVIYGDDADPKSWEQMRHVLAAYNAGYAVVTDGKEPRIPKFYETIRYVHDIESLVKGQSVWVERGETLKELSARTGVSVSSLLRGNIDVTGEHDLMAGSVLSLPDDAGMSRIVVKRGMSLTSIHRRTGVTVSELVNVNQIERSNIIHVGEVLRIPAHSQGVM